MAKMRFDQSVVLVVGASGGLGQAIAQAFSRAGSRLALAGRNAEVLADLADRLGGAAFQADLTNRESLIHLRDALLEQYGRVDLVVNATGYDVRQSFEAHTPAELEQSVQVNLLGAMHLTQVFLPVMPSGRIVHLGGFADGRLAFPYYAADSAARAGVASFIEALNRELRLQGRAVRLLYFSPAPADTPAEQPFHPIWKEMGVRIVSPEQVASELLHAIQRGGYRQVMGGPLTVFFAWLNAAFPRLADVLMMNHYGTILHRYFGGEAQPAQSKSRQGWLRWLGIFLVVLSFVLYGLLPAVPFLPLPAAVKISLAPGLVVSGEAAFWVGGLLLGKEVLGKIKGWGLRAWKCCFPSCQSFKKGY
jgi:short-subunit dehydrogenase